VSDDLSTLLADLDIYINDYIVLPTQEHATAVTLWAAATWMGTAQFDAWSYLAVTSPEKGSGKTRLLEVLATVVRQPWLTAMPSPAALYTQIDQKHPTLLLDEVDAVFSQNSDSAEAMRGVLNAGNRRSGTVSRVEMAGGKRTVVEFSPFCPKALAGIRSLPETLADRSIVIPLRRKKRSEEVQPFRSQVVGPRADALRARLIEQLAGGPDLQWVRSFDEGEIKGLSDRQIEGYQPLFTLAGMAGGGWLRDIMLAAPVIAAAQREADDTAEGALLLRHIREAFESENSDHIRTRTLLATLRERDDGPWAIAFNDSWDFEDKKAGSLLAKMLRPYGVKSRRPRFEDGQHQGYIAADFADAWHRYLPEER
jgi:hypothetical protein